MKSFLLVLVVLGLAAAAVAVKCDNDCKRENNCACPSSKSPLPMKDTPQFVTLTFDDAIYDVFYKDYLSKLFVNRTNPDDTPITATFYVPHSYSDYSLISKLYNDGHDIGLHSVTKDVVDYWREATEEQLIMEFGDNSKIITRFSNVPSKDLIGVRTPHLQIAGNKTYSAYTKLELQYDSSWVVSRRAPLFPFTLDYPPNPNCFVGVCPTRSQPGFWVLPIISLFGKNKTECNALAACQIEGSALEISNWLISEYLTLKQHYKVPITLMVSLSWFKMVESSYEGLKLFLDYLENINDTYVVSHREVFSWSQNPVPLNNYRTNYNKKNIYCVPGSFCYYKNENMEEREMRMCYNNVRKCPEVYPWLGNPEGKP